MRHADDPSYNPDDITVLPPRTEAERAVVSEANALVHAMHPGNAEAQYERVVEVLGGLTGPNAEEHRKGPLRAALETRDAMKRMGANRAARGWHPVPDHLQHLLTPEERGNG